MRTARAALAILLSVAIPVRAETTTDPLWYLLSTYVLAPDTRAVEAGGEGSTDAKGLAGLQSDLLLLSDGLESFRDEAQVKETLARLEPRMSPELRPFFKDRASSLDAIYRTLAVADYTWAGRFPEPICDPHEDRRRLLGARDGLFQDGKGLASPWLVSLLGPAAEGRSAEQALDQASAQTRLSGAEYEKLRAKVRKLTLALASEKAEGAARSKLYCARASAFEDLAAHHGREERGATLASRSASRASPEPSVFVVVWNSRRAAATLLDTKAGPVLVTDASVVEGTDHPRLFAFSAKDAPVALTATVVRRDPGLGLAILSYSENLARPALATAKELPSKNELMTAVGHTEVSGLWTRTSGLVTKSGPGSFQTDAAVSADFTGGPVLNEAGEFAGLLVLRPADTEEGRWPVAVPAGAILRWLDGEAAAAPEAEVVETAGTAAVLSRTRPSALTETGLGAWNIPPMGPPPPEPRGVCMSNCGGPSAPRRPYPSSSGGSSYDSGGKELGEALGKLGAVLILEGIPALFRGLGKLFKGNGTSKPKAPAQRIVKESPPPPPPKPTCRLEKVAAPATAGAEPFEVAVKLSCTGNNLPLAGHAVKFSFEWDGVKSTQTVTLMTDASGVASLPIQVSNMKTAVLKVRSIAERNHDELDRYDPDKKDPEEPAELIQDDPVPVPGPAPLHASDPSRVEVPVEKAFVTAVGTTGIATGAGRLLTLGGAGKVLRVTVVFVPSPALAAAAAVLTVKLVFDIGWAIGSVAERKISDVQRGLKQYDKTDDRSAKREEKNHKCMPATPSNIKAVVQTSEMKTMQPSVSSPGVQTYVDMIEMGNRPDPIETDGDVIVEGNHRYIAGLLCRIEVDRTPATAPLSAPRYPIRQIKVDEMDWRQ